jgi:hypothetical protein
MVIRGVIILSIITGYIVFVGFPEELFPQILVSKPVPASQPIPVFTPVPAFEPIPSFK